MSKDKSWFDTHLIIDMDLVEPDPQKRKKLEKKVKEEIKKKISQ